MLNRLRPRGQSRFRVDLPARFREPGTFKWSEGSLVNLSAGGLCLQTKAPLMVKDRLEIEVPTVDREGREQKRRLHAVVLWRRGRRFGLRFVSERNTKISE